jgi:hypothetical protein
MSIQDYGFYRIQNVRSAGEKEVPAGYLYLQDASMASGKPIMQRVFPDPAFDFTDQFEFLFIEVEDDAKPDAAGRPNVGKSYYIVNRRSGLSLVVDDTRNGAPLKQVAWPPLADGVNGEGKPIKVAQPMMAQFVLKPVAGYDNRYRIMSQYAGTYLLVDTTNSSADKVPFKPGRNGNPVRAYNESKLPADEGIELALEFTFEHVAAAFAGGKLEADADGDTRDQLKRIMSMSDALPRSTDVVLLEYDSIPYFWVNDPVFPPHRQVELSPYYTLRRSRLWQKMYDRELDGVVTRESTETVRCGMKTTDAYTFRSAFRFSLETSMSMSAKFWGVGMSASVTAKLETEVEMTIERSAERTLEYTTEDKIIYPSVGHPYRIARWRPVDRYNLCRANDGVLYTWDIVQEGEEVIDVYPTVPRQKEWGRRER